MTTIEPIARPATEVAVDLYRDIHKAIRNELFSITVTAGQLDPADACARQALADQLGDLVAMLRSHAEHEDGPIQPVLERVRPDLARMIDTDHPALERRLDELQALAAQAVAAGTDEARPAIHELYLELASFTSAYLAHQDLEERVIMPVLTEDLGNDGVAAMHGAIIAAIPEPELVATLARMFPVMNVDDRTELLGGMRAGAPAEVFAGVWSLAASVLPASDTAAVAARLGV